jgi:hypothetical protein
VPSLVALQGQFLVRNRRERGGTREMLRGGDGRFGFAARCGVGGRGVRGGVGANAGPGNVDRVQPVGALQMLELRTGLTGRKGRPGRARDCIPGWWTWPYRPESQGLRWGRRGTSDVMCLSNMKVTTQNVAEHLYFGALSVSCVHAFSAFTHSRRCCVSGL